ncbi:hypothetical protein ACIQRW_26335 [Streptomyces sp. NPDC091287]|uniref:hypothetical protein n=1 Tax=Streptomyces sp. NPDC091287 TaxID=3365988 RepID=UPI00380C6418
MEPDAEGVEPDAEGVEPDAEGMKSKPTWRRVSSTAIFIGSRTRTEGKAQWSFPMRTHSAVTEFTGGSRRAVARATAME